MIEVICGDCLEVMPRIPGESIDAIFTDPPYPEIDREYGRISEARWLDMMDAAMWQFRRVLKPTGSAIVVLQSNSEYVGRSRTWLWKFLARWGDDWGIVQDLYWWNTKAQPTVHVNKRYGLTRPSVKYLAWFGDSGCYRDQSAVMQPISESTKSDRRVSEEKLKKSPSGAHFRHSRSIGTAISRGSATPFNLFRFGNPGSVNHPGSTPYALTEKFVRYICPVGGVVLDPFAGCGTTGRAAVALGMSSVMIEQVEEYCDHMRVEFIREAGDDRP